MNKKIRSIGVIAIVTIWALLTGFGWFGPKTEISEAERRPLAQMPEITVETLLNGKFMSEFEDYSLDQFPLRDTFRQVKSLFHYYVLGQKDNNDIYIADGYAVKQEYPYNPESVDHALSRFNYLYEKYLADSGSEIFMTIVPDKGYYLGESSGHLTMDYEAMFSAFEAGMPWAEFVDITDTLSAGDYYRTDTHWRQENLLDTAAKLCEALGVAAPRAEDYTPTALERSFYGVYYGQAALPMDPDEMFYLTNEVLENCTVKCHDNGTTAQVLDKTKLGSKDLYDVFLSGGAAVLEITNPAGQSGKELIVFRDSFGSSMVPLLVNDYETVWVLDTRYVNPGLLDRFVDFHGQDVLMLYSTLILNSSSALRK